MRSENLKSSELVKFSKEISSISSTNEKIKRIKDFLERSYRDEISIVSSIISGEKIIPIFIGYSTISEALDAVRDEGEEIKAIEVFEFIDKVKNLKGEGSREERFFELTTLFSRLKKEERIFLAKYILGDLKHGASKGVVIKAISSLFGIDKERIRLEYAKAGEYI